MTDNDDEDREKESGDYEAGEQEKAQLATQLYQGHVNDFTALYTIQRQEYKQICHRPFVGVLISVIPAINLKGLIIMKPTLRESLYLQIH